MSCCTKNTLKRCLPVSVCGDEPLELPYDTLMDGDYTVVLDFLQSQIRIVVIAEGGKVALPLNTLNENYYYEGRLFDSAGALQLIDDDHETFAFTTALIANSNNSTQQIF